MMARQWSRYGMLVLIVWTLAGRCEAVSLSDSLTDPIVMPGQPTYGLNLDGVALLGSPTPGIHDVDDVISLCTGVLIRPRHVLTAAHCLDEDQDGRLDPEKGFVFPFAAIFELEDRLAVLKINPFQSQIAPGWTTEFADVAVMYLSQDAPPDIPRYKLYGGRDEVGQEAVIVGYGPFGTGLFGHDPVDLFGGRKRAGRNRLEVTRGNYHLGYDFDSGREENNAFAQLGTSSDLGVGDDEAIGTPGDSGGPVFIGGAIAGITSYRERVAGADVNDQRDSSWGEVGLATRVSAFRRFLLDATDGQAVFTGLPNPCGDLDLDHDVDSADLLQLLGSWTGSLDSGVGDRTWSLGDCDQDRDIDSADLLEFIGNWTGAEASNTAAVPEPTPWLLGWGVLLVWARCRADR